MMTEIKTIEGSQKDALLRRANIKKNVVKEIGAFIVYSLSFNLTDLNWTKEQSTYIRYLWLSVPGCRIGILGVFFTKPKAYKDVPLSLLVCP